MNERTTLLDRMKRMGPAAIVTSAFIGPGTVITATVAGANFSYSLLWVVLLAVIALMVLMEMASRIGIAGKMDSIEAAISIVPESAFWKRLVQIVIAAATLGVCFAFEVGNFVGASVGLMDFTGMPKWGAVVLLAVMAIITVFMSSYAALTRIMQIFVGAMGIIFLVTMIAVLPSLPAILKGLLIPTINQDNVINALALVGTTLIGVNLVLHSITSQQKWAGTGDVKKNISDARIDIIFNIAIGGIITMSILIVAAAVLYGTNAKVNSPLVFTKSLEPVLGSWARVVGDIGLFAAGASSVITIPFTLRSILSRIFKWENGFDSTPARVLGVIVVLFGAALAIAGTSPVQIIIFAQATSGFALPFIAALLLIAANNKKVLGEYVNKTWQNVVGFIAVILAFILGFWGLFKIVSPLFK